MHCYLVVGKLNDWNRDVGTFSIIVDVDFEIDSKESFYRLVDVVRKLYADRPSGGYSYTSISVTSFQKIS